MYICSQGVLDALFTYIYPERVLPKVLLLRLVVGHGIGIEPGEALGLEPLLQAGDAPAGGGEVAQEHGQHQRLVPGLVQPGPDHVTEEFHHAVLLVVPRVVGVGRVDPARAEHAIQEVPRV